MGFLDALLTPKTLVLREKILAHPLWQGMQDGTLARQRLGRFALQDYWLVRQAYELDGLTIAAVRDHALQELLVAKLAAKLHADGLLVDFGLGVGLTSEDFVEVTPLAGCMALTTFFYWVIAHGTDVEIVAAISASEAIFTQICLRVYPALQAHYHLSAQQVAFFAAHEAIGDDVDEIAAFLQARTYAAEEQTRIDRMVHLSHEFELLFYDTIMAADGA